MSSVSSFEGETKKPKGAVLFTGPDGIGDFKVGVREQRFIGHGSMSPEASGDTRYLYRAAKDCPHPQPKTARVGEIGWGVLQLSDNSLLNTGHQIMLKEFRQAAEDRHTHLYQNPYYPPQPTSDRHTLSPPKEVRIHVAAESQHSNEECRSEHSTHSLHSKASSNTLPPDQPNPDN